MALLIGEIDIQSYETGLPETGEIGKLYLDKTTAMNSEDPYDGTYFTWNGGSYDEFAGPRPKTPSH